MEFNQHHVFSINSPEEFHEKALQIFQYQYRENKVYHEFCHYLKIQHETVRQLKDIPFLPIQFFKSKKVIIEHAIPEVVFTSSGTTGATTSNHFVSDLSIYDKSFQIAFELFYGPVSEYCILALLPSYLEREGSSLIYMANTMISQSKHPNSGFYLNNLNELTATLRRLVANNEKVLLLGVSFALLDLAERVDFKLSNVIVMETGGMKGRRREMVRNELHAILKKAFGVPTIHSEYGMTELLSQAYAKREGIFHCPPWMSILIRDTEDPLTYQKMGKTGGINIIDLANVNSCSFIATQDLGKMVSQNAFEVLGRFDHADIRGCNLMVI
ncbi:MAG: acyl transferase [Croceivirga sp.]